MFVFVDIETTGLDEDTCDILELGMAVVSDDLENVRARSWIIGPQKGLKFYKQGIDDYVLQMHSKNGLFDAIDCGAGRDRHEVASAAVEFCLANAGPVEGILLAGSSVHFDRRFLRRWMPMLDGVFHYRNIDVSTITELVKIWHPKAVPGKRETDHRVLTDIQNTVELLRYYRSVFFGEI